MIDYSTIAGIISTGKLAIDTASSIIKAEGALEEKGKKAELLLQINEIHDTLFSLREIIFNLQKERSELYEKIKKQDDWNEKASSYELVKTPGGAYVYASKKQPKHYVCPKCFEEKRTYILESERCPNCQNYFSIDKKPTSFGGDPADSFSGWMGV